MPPLAVFALQVVYRKQSCWFQAIEQKCEQVKSNNRAESYKNIHKCIITIFAIKQLVKYMEIIYLLSFVWLWDIVCLFKNIIRWSRAEFWK